MAIDQRALLETVYDLIHDAVAAVPNSAGQATPIFVSMQFPGINIDAKRYENPWSPHNPEGSYASLEHFAHLVDAVPLLSRVHTASHQRIDRLYGQILKVGSLSSAFKSASSKSSASDREFADAYSRLYDRDSDYYRDGTGVTVRVETPAYAQYRTREAARVSDLTNYLAAYLQQDFNAQGMQAWQSLKPALASEVRSTGRVFQQAEMQKIEDARAALTRNAVAGVSFLFEEALANYVSLRRASLIFDGGGRGWHITYATPGNWYSEKASTKWTKVSISGDRAKRSQIPLPLKGRNCFRLPPQPGSYGSLFEYDEYCIEWSPSPEPQINIPDLFKPPSIPWPSVPGLEPEPVPMVPGFLDPALVDLFGPDRPVETPFYPYRFDPHLLDTDSEDPYDLGKYFLSLRPEPSDPKPMVNQESWGLWTHVDEENRLITTASVEDQTKDVDISFKFARVEIYRPWLDPLIFSLPGWTFAGLQAGDLSTGSITDNAGILPLIPVAFIIAKDIHISADWSETDAQRAMMAASEDAPPIGFGPFSLSGQYYMNQPATQPTSTFDGTTISSPGVQIIGWVNQLVPFCPPL
jgi:hypothetical protein